MTTFPDIQGKRLHSSFILSRVGISGVKRPVTINRPKGSISLVPEFDISVDLPARQKGSHMSRHLEVINKAIDMAVEEQNDSLEKLVERITRELLRSHEYATYADVRLSADYFLKKRSPDDREVIENYRIFAEARSRRGERDPFRSIGVEVSGLSACPCAMENVRELLKRELRKNGESKEAVSVLDRVPVPTHNQRNRAFIEVGWTKELNLEADDLVELLESNISSPTYEMLKRKGEAELVLAAHRNPKFVEDIVRDILKDFLERYRELPDDVKIHVRSVSEESIHKHDAFAERVTDLGTLRKGSFFENDTLKS
ncbi:MAG: GTP cyclohydrolase I FolE2 [Candidatus Thermoplasmatota archaeon]|nr:GTP cyclohydrolase I FolE2 [Candidatus Thermoplasmatota archaeon]